MSENPLLDSTRWIKNISGFATVRDLECRIVWSNANTIERFGWPSASPSDPFDPGDENETREAAQHCDSIGTWFGQYNRVDAQGNTIELNSRWNTISDDDGTVVGYFIHELDISEEQRNSEHIRRAQRMESIGTLAGGVAHDINNVLGPILIGAEMIKRKVDDPWVQKKLEGIEASARRGAEIVKQVLDFSRGAEGEKIAVQFRHTLKEVVSFAEHTFSKSIDIESNFNRDLEPILGDAVQLRQCVLSLMVNARDAMPNGGTLTCSANNVVLSAADAIAISPHGTEGSYVRIDIQDTGSGIKPEMIDRIYEPFFTTKTRGQGTGLGLSTALSIVRGHEGFMSVKSKVGQGTTFSLFIPTAQTAVVPEETTAEVQENSSSGWTILVVDDEPLVLEMNVDMLESFDFTAFGAENGKVGLDLFNANAGVIDLILTDINMPVMDGPTMIREIRKINPAIPIVAVSGLTEDQHFQDGTGLDGIEILSKPYSTDQLLAAINLKLGGIENKNPRPPSNDLKTLTNDAFDQFLSGGDW